MFSTCPRGVGPTDEHVFLHLPLYETLFMTTPEGLKRLYATLHVQMKYLLYGRRTRSVGCNRPRSIGLRSRPIRTHDHLSWAPSESCSGGFRSRIPDAS